MIECAKDRCTATDEVDSIMNYLKYSVTVDTISFEAFVSSYYDFCGRYYVLYKIGYTTVQRFTHKQKHAHTHARTQAKRVINCKILQINVT